MTRLELIYPTPAPVASVALEQALVGIDRARLGEITVTPTTRVRSWTLPNRRLARMARRRVLEAFKQCGEPVPGVSITSVRGVR